jgi:hypothetical protein
MPPTNRNGIITGVLVSLLTPRKPISCEEVCRILDEERAQMDVGTHAD